MSRTLRFIVVAAFLAVGSVPAQADSPAAAHYKQGLAFKNQGKEEDAIAAFEKAVAADARHAMAWASLGHLYKKKKDYPKAVAAYENASKLMTKDAVVWVAIAACGLRLAHTILPATVRGEHPGVRWLRIGRL